MHPRPFHIQLHTKTSKAYQNDDQTINILGKGKSILFDLRKLYSQLYVHQNMLSSSHIYNILEKGKPILFYLGIRIINLQSIIF
ncbi:hypothetical protein Patl1_07792 [Pistacia atlantica]|uniref:Uncharacterized protein n=1 Tax=Pistacia atlantica TaxID=434234 RepID=A0ACC1AE77_9ROSI|nr:hypothetical protein Patl1_07792 [Pistacia atlantica]